MPVVLDPLQNLPRNFDQLGARLDNAAILNDAGVTIAFSAEGDAPHNARKLRQAAGVAVANGLPYEVALAGLTVNPAAIFGLKETQGILSQGSAGKSRDLERRPAGSDHHCEYGNSRRQEDSDGLPPDPAARPLFAAESAAAEGLYQTLNPEDQCWPCR